MKDYKNAILYIKYSMGFVILLLLIWTVIHKKPESIEGNFEKTKGATLVQNIELKVVLEPDKTYQTIESIGVSGAWWSQVVGQWTDKTADNQDVRDYIAQILFDTEKGIGLTAYRYNIGAGSKESGNSPLITDSWRRTESFETAPGVYDWNKDAGAVWFLRKAVELGVNDVVFFVNSPLERLTINGKAYGASNGSTTSNLAEENYSAFADYVLDVTKHFAEEGIPITSISPMNEPQWEWTSGQEGCHYEPQEMALLLKTFIQKKEQVKSLSRVVISAPEAGEWGNTSYPYYNAILDDEILDNYFTSFDVHSYWSDKNTKASFVSWIGTNHINPVLRTTEWCEMKNGRDLTMDSALNLAMEINDDMTTLNVVSWQYWIAVSCYNYRDGLLYVNPDSHKVTETKRLWAMGNFSRFIRPGYQRIGCNISNGSVKVSAYQGTREDGQKETIIVLINQNSKSFNVNSESIQNDWTRIESYTTDKNNNLEQSIYTNKKNDDSSIEIPAKSVVTLRII